jgi:hypothetical protein
MSLEMLHEFKIQVIEGSGKQLENDIAALDLFAENLFGS